MEKDRTTFETEVLTENFESSDKSPPGIPVSWWKNLISTTRGSRRNGTDHEIRNRFPGGGFLILDEDGEIIGEGMETVREGRTEADIEGDETEREEGRSINELDLIERFGNFLIGCGFPKEWILGLTILGVYVPGVLQKIHDRLSMKDHRPYDILMDLRKVAGMFNRHEDWHVEVPKECLGYLHEWKRLIDQMRPLPDMGEEPGRETEYWPHPLQRHDWWDREPDGPMVWSNEEIVKAFVPHILNLHKKNSSKGAFLSACHKYLGKIRDRNREVSKFPLRDLHKIVGIMLSKTNGDLLGNVSEIFTGKPYGFVPMSAQPGHFTFTVHSRTFYNKNVDEQGEVMASVMKSKWARNRKKAEAYWTNLRVCGKALIVPPPKKIYTRKDLMERFIWEDKEIFGEKFFDEDFFRKHCEVGNSHRQVQKIGMTKLEVVGEREAAKEIHWEWVCVDPYNFRGYWKARPGPRVMVAKKVYRDTFTQGWEELL